MFTERSKFMFEECQLDKFCNTSELINLVLKAQRNSRSLLEVNRDLRDLFVSCADIDNSRYLFSSEFADILTKQRRVLDFKGIEDINDLRNRCLKIGIDVLPEDSNKVFALKMGLSYLASEEVINFIFNDEYKIIYTNKFTSDSGMPSMQIREYCLRKSTPEFPVIVLGDFIYPDTYENAKPDYSVYTRKLHEIINKFGWHGNTHRLYYQSGIPFQAYSNYFNDYLPYVTEYNEESLTMFYTLDTMLDPLLQYDAKIVSKMLKKYNNRDITEYYNLQIDILQETFNNKKIENIGIVLGLFYPGGSYLKLQGGWSNGYGHCESLVVSGSIGLYYDSTHDIPYRNASILKNLSKITNVEGWIANVTGPQKDGAYCCLYSFELIENTIDNGVWDTIKKMYINSYSPSELPVAKYTVGTGDVSSNKTKVKMLLQAFSQNDLLSNKKIDHFYYY